MIAGPAAGEAALPGSEVAVADYLTDPEAIYRRSFALARAACDLSAFPGDLAELVVRLVHAYGEPEIAKDIAWSGDPVAAGTSALKSGAPILADCNMVAAGITPRLLPLSNPVVVTLEEPGVKSLAKAEGKTRSMVSVDLWQPHLAGALVAIGNAPTALFRLLELLDEGAPRPAAILAFPVGFVGAAESKRALAEARLEIPYVTLHGRRGGSALAAAAVNALAILARP
ncbi:MAG: precorrin-8X methylmutase [Kiloniellales bacterium]